VSIFDWLRLFRRKDKTQAVPAMPQAAPESESESNVAIANIFDILSSDEDLRKVDLMYRNVIWGRDEATAMMALLHEHMNNGDHDDLMDCDTWCVPSALARRIDNLTWAQLVVVFLVTLKSHGVATARLNQRDEES
jgi:hypothetical protein